MSGFEERCTGDYQREAEGRHFAAQERPQVGRPGDFIVTGEATLSETREATALEIVNRELGMRSSALRELLSSLVALKLKLEGEPDIKGGLGEGSEAVRRDYGIRGHHGGLLSCIDAELWSIEDLTGDAFTAVAALERMI